MFRNPLPDWEQENPESNDIWDDIVIDIDNPHSGFRTAPEAFKALINETVIHALSKEYAPPMTILHAFLDAFCEEEKFSWVKTAKLAGALSIGGLASIFIINPVTTTASTLQNAFKAQTGIDLSYNQILTNLFRVANLGSNAALATFSGLNLIEAYLGHSTNAEKFLQYQTATCTETSKKIGRKVFDLNCALAANVPTFFFAAASTNIYLAIFIVLANSSISWLGVSNMPLTFSHIHPARRTEIAYLNEQLETFLKLPTTEQNEILDEIDAIRRVEENSDNTYKKVYARLLNLARPVNKKTQIPEEIKIQERHPPSHIEQALAVTLVLYMNASQINFTEASYAGISHLFADSTSPLAITSGAVAAAFAFLPNAGFGYSTGVRVANTLVSDNVPLAKLYLAKTRTVLKYTIDLISLFGSGTSFIIAMNACNDYADLLNIKGTLENILKIFEGVVSYSTGMLVSAHYMLRLCDEILIFLAQRCGDEKIKRLFTVVLETRRLIKVLGETNEENYLELLRWKMEGDTELSDLLHSIFDNRMSADEYNKTRRDVNTIDEIIKDRIKLPHYRVIDSFFAKETAEWKRQHPGFRRRVGEFFASKKSDDIELPVTETPRMTFEM